MKKLAFIIWVFSLLLNAQQVAAANGDVRLIPAAPSATIGEGFSLEVRVESAAEKVGSYDFTVMFDSTLLALDPQSTGIDGTAVVRGSDGLNTNLVNNQVPGQLILSGFDTGGKGPGTDLHLLTIHFTAIGVTAGTPVDLSITDLTNELGALVGTPNAIDSTVTVLPTYTLTVTAPINGTVTSDETPPGIDCGADCTEVYVENTAVTLTATPDAGYALGAWSGDCDANGAVTMDADKTCGVTFVPILHTLTVTTVGDGTVTSAETPPGIDCGTDCTEDYMENTAVTLTATPDAGYVFGSWSGDCATNGMVTMDSDKACTATFLVSAPTPTPTPIPTLSWLGLMMLSLLVGLMGTWRHRFQLG